MIGLVSPRSSPRNIGNGVNFNHPFCSGLQAWYRAGSVHAPSNAAMLRDLTGRFHAPLASGTSLPCVPTVIAGGIPRLLPYGNTASGPTYKTSQNPLGSIGAACAVGGWLYSNGNNFNNATLASCGFGGSGDAFSLGENGASPPHINWTKTIGFSSATITSDVATGGAQWVLGVCDANGAMRLYVNGVKQSGTGTKPGTMSPGAVLTVGKPVNFNLMCVGDVLLWGRSFTDDQALALYQEALKDFPSMRASRRLRAKGAAGGGARQQTFSLLGCGA